MQLIKIGLLQLTFSKSVCLLILEIYTHTETFGIPVIVIICKLTQKIASIDQKIMLQQYAVRM